MRLLEEATVDETCLPSSTAPLSWDSARTEEMRDIVIEKKKRKKRETNDEMLPPPSRSVWKRQEMPAAVAARDGQRGGSLMGGLDSLATRSQL